MLRLFPRGAPCGQAQASEGLLGSDLEPRERPVSAATWAAEEEATTGERALCAAQCGRPGTRGRWLQRGSPTRRGA